MTDRITEAALALILREAAAGMETRHAEAERDSCALVYSLANEVRRLRGLLKKADGDCCIWADDHKGDCPLIVEARAIRDEQGG